MKTFSSFNISMTLILLLLYAQTNFATFLQKNENEFYRQISPKRILVENVCPPHKYGVDCSKQPTHLLAEEVNNVNLERNTWNYFYVSLAGNKDNHLILEFHYTTGPFKAALLFTSSVSSILPDLNIHSYKLQTAPSNHRSWELEVPKDDINSNLKASNDELMIGIYYDFESEIGLKIKPTFGSDSSTLTIILITIGAVGVVINIIGCAYFIKYRLKKELEIAVRQHFEGTHRHLTNHPMYYNHQNNRYELDPDAPLTQEDLNIYFPCTQFENLKSPFGQIECPICLEELKQDAECRQLYCEHIFHNHCIQFWLSKHQACPNCKKDMKRNAIVLHFASQKKSEAITNKEDDEQHEPPNTEAHFISEETSIVKANKMEEAGKILEENIIKDNQEQEIEKIEENSIATKEDKVIINITHKTKIESEKEDKEDIIELDDIDNKDKDSSDDEEAVL